MVTSYLKRSCEDLILMRAPVEVDPTLVLQPAAESKTANLFRAFAGFLGIQTALTGSSTEIQSLLGKTVVAWNQQSSAASAEFQKLFASVKIAAQRKAPSVNDGEVAQLAYKLLTDKEFASARQYLSLTKMQRGLLEKDLRAKFDLDFKIAHKIYSGLRYWPLATAAQGITLTAGTVGGYISPTEVINGLIKDGKELGLGSVVVSRMIVLAFPFTAMIEDYLIQDGLLTKLPKALLRCCNKEHVIESKSYRVVKCFLSAIIESSGRAYPFEGDQNSKNYLILSSFVTKLVSAFVREKTRSAWSAASLYSTVPFLRI